MFEGQEEAEMEAEEVPQEQIEEEDLDVVDENPYIEEQEEEEPFVEVEASAEDEAAQEEEGQKGRGGEKSMIEPSAVQGKCMVRQRQKLRTAVLAERFCSQLQARVEEEKAAGAVLTFEDFDISENKLPPELLESIFSTLADSSVHVERFRAFGCATLDDQAATLLAGWLAGVTTETVPYEMHLSDCAITANGFQDMMRAIAENDAFPGPDPRAPSRGPLPLYMRLEHNYIETSVMEQAVADGVAMKMKKGHSDRRAETVKVRLMLGRNGGFDQKTGEPPAPEDALAPKPLRGGQKGSGRKGSGGGSPWESRDRGGKGKDDRGGKGKDGKGGREERRLPPWQALPAPRPMRDNRRPFRSPEPKRRGALRSPEPRRKGGGGAKNGGYDFSWDASRAPYNAFAAKGGGCKGHGGGGSPAAAAAAKRGGAIGVRSEEPSSKRPRAVFRPSAAVGGVGSRDASLGGKGGRSTSASGKGGGKRMASEAGPGVAGRGGRLPQSWEEHWSEEYNMPYFWNSKTGDSSWEKPQANGGGAK